MFQLHLINFGLKIILKTPKRAEFYIPINALLYTIKY